jgi:hypothetical protein
MNLLPGTVRLTADGLVGKSGKECRVYSVHLVSASGTAAQVILKNGTSTSGTAYAQVDGTASKGVTVSFAGGLLFPAGCYADVTVNSGDYVCVIASNEQ